MFVNSEHKPDIKNTVPAKVQRASQGLCSVSSTVFVDCQGTAKIIYNVGNSEDLTPAEALDLILQPGIKIKGS